MCHNSRALDERLLTRTFGTRSKDYRIVQHQKEQKPEHGPVRGSTDQIDKEGDKRRRNGKRVRFQASLHAVQAEPSNLNDKVDSTPSRLNRLVNLGNIALCLYVQHIV